MSGRTRRKPTIGSLCPSPHLWTAFIGSIEARGAAAFSSVTDFVQLLVPGSDPDLLQASGVRAKLSTKSYVEEFPGSSLLPWHAQTNSVERFYCGKCTGIWSKFRMFCARSAPSSPLFSQALDRGVLNPALFWTASAHP